MDDLQDVYNDLIMEHSMNSYNKKHLDNPDFWYSSDISSKNSDLTSGVVIVAKYSPWANFEYWFKVTELSIQDSFIIEASCLKTLTPL
mgnify:CR=1 FL=1